MASTASANELGDEWPYTIQRGDTLIGIGQRLLSQPGGWRKVQRLNRVANPRRLRPGAILRIPRGWLRLEAASAQLLDVVGTVRLGDLPVTSGQLRGGETLETGPDSSVLLRFGDGTQLRVSPASKLTLEQALVLRGNLQHLQTLQLHQGAVETQVRREVPRPRFEIRAPVLTLGARGTEFRLRYDDATRKAQGAVDEGRVAARAAAAGEVQLDAGFGISERGVPVALQPPPSWGAPALRAERLPVRLSWPAQPGAAAWHSQVHASATGGLLAERRTEAASAEFGSLADGEYRLRLRAVDSEGIAGRPADAVLTVAARPEPPFLAEPAPGAQRVGSQATFQWLQTQAATRYRLQLASEADFAAPVQDLRDLQASQVTLELSPGRWFWRLASVRADGRQGPWSDVQSFEQKPSPPAAPGVPGSSTTGDGKLSLRWSAGSEGDRYEFQLARDGTFAERLLERRSDTPVLELEGLEPGQYHVRARIVDGRGMASDWSPTSVFEVPRSNAWWWIPAALLLLLAL